MQKHEPLKYESFPFTRAFSSLINSKLLNIKTGINFYDKSRDSIVDASHRVKNELGRVEQKEDENK